MECALPGRPPRIPETPETQPPPDPHVKLGRDPASLQGPKPPPPGEPLGTDRRCGREPRALDSWPGSWGETHAQQVPPWSGLHAGWGPTVRRTPAERP